MIITLITFKLITTVLHAYKSMFLHSYFFFSDEGEDSSPTKNVQAEKCKFWPDCKNGDDCPFYHPTVTCR